MFFAPVLIVTALATLALVSILLVNIAESQEEPCPRPYIKVIKLRAGMPGDEVTIRGRRFGTDEGEVYFSPRVKAEVVKWSMHRIYVVVPEAATTGSVIVSLRCGTVSNEHYFTVTK
jgi:hypothetical protein